MLSVYVDENGKPYKTAGKIDYVAAWYFKSVQYICNTPIRCAFVSTNSITQGEQVAAVWKALYLRFGVHIDFAWRTFKWGNESNDAAAVHCVIVGFSVCSNNQYRRIYENGSVIEAHNINPYLVDAENVFIESKSKPIVSAIPMVYGNKPTDGGFLYLSPEERREALKKEPSIEPYIKRIIGSTEYINNTERYCLWLVNAPENVIEESPFIKDRVNRVRSFRLESTKEATRKSASSSTLFQEVRQPDCSYIVVPRVSSERRRYVPIGFLPSEIIVNDSVQIIPNGSIFLFGVISSSIHMGWMRTVAGRLKSDYRYSKDIVYNNFPWPTPTDDQKAAIEQTAQGILDARALYPDKSLADLYDPDKMPPELKAAHEANDKAVMDAYGFSYDMTEPQVVAELMKMYQELTANL